MTDFYLFANSATSVTLNPLYDFKSETVKNISMERSPTGTLFMYQFGTYRRFKVPLTYVTSADKTRIESWWAVNTTVYFMEQGGTAVQVKIVNESTPFSQRVKPYFNLFAGQLELETP